MNYLFPKRKLSTLLDPHNPIVPKSRPERKREEKPNQLSLFDGQSEPATLSICSVPRRKAIESRRYYLRVKQGKQTWDYPIQFKFSEAEKLLPKLQLLDWTLDDRGVPINALSIHTVVEQLVDGGVAC